MIKLLSIKILFRNYKLFIMKTVFIINNLNFHYMFCDFKLHLLLHAISLQIVR